MHAALWVLPDFALILLGMGVRKRLQLDRHALAVLERLVYYLLFPALLFQSILRSPINHASAILVYAALGVVAGGVVLGNLARWKFRNAPAVRFASGVQCAYRFNSYFGFALISQIAGPTGLAPMALMVGVAVPVCNMVAVWTLARQAQTGPWLELAKNPLLLTTLAAVTLNLAGWQPPDLMNVALDHLGAGAIALGLLSVGASLCWNTAQTCVGLMAYWALVKLILMPLLAVALAHVLELTSVQTLALVIFAGLPAPANAYVLTMRMSGEGGVVSAMISLTTALSIFTLPFWISHIGYA